MFKSITIALGFLLLTSCASTYVTTLKKADLPRPFSSVMVVCIENETNVKEFNEDSFNEFIRGDFNSFENMTYRKQLERSLKRNIAKLGFPNVNTTSELFEDDEDYSYEAFMEKISKTSCQAILLINLNDYWTTTDYVTNHYENVSVTRESTEPNYRFYCNLFNIEGLGRYIWTGDIVAEGIFAGYDTLNNHMSRRLSAKLRKDKMIY